jgi:OOP family OmpA-OmpF porin
MSLHPALRLRVLGGFLVTALLAAPLPEASADRAPPPSRAALKMDGQRLVTGAVEFETGSGKLKLESDAVLDLVKQYLDEKTYVTTLRIEVHSDSQGDAAKNQELSEKRAVAIAKALIGKGVDCKRLIAVGFGSSKPVADNATAEGRAQNRRVSFFVAALRGRAIGGMPLDGGGKSAAGDLCAPR